MNIINFFESDRQEHWLEEIARSNWGAGDFLCELLSNGTFFDAVGEGSKVLLLTDGDELISFCTYAQKDDIQPTELTPWMGFVYTFPKHRGHRYVGLLFEEIERLEWLFPVRRTAPWKRNDLFQGEFFIHTLVLKQ